jgi:soluble lytic murein transglycosylase-like protein
VIGRRLIARIGAAMAMATAVAGGVANAARASDLGAVYAAGSASFQQAYAATLDAYRAAMQIDRAAPTQSAPDDLGALYVTASAAFQQAYAATLNAYRAAMQAERLAPPQSEPSDLGALYATGSAAFQQAYAATLDTYRSVMPADRPAPTAAETGDPVLGNVVAEASNRFDLPELWIRAVMQVESDGDAGATSPKGAMGLMQVMPETYAYLSDRYGLGDDPYAPRNNVLAGSAYLREMYDRYGAAGFVAAYNAGPGRYEDSLCRGCTLPEETKRYVASVRLALGEVLFGEPKSRFFEPIAISPTGALLLRRTGEPVSVTERLALHSLVARAVQRAAAK